ncbi:MAG: shikimate dehydrogenase [Patescibacteria group bacterium]|nr:shikimate dehydrogenase [Patescibacteria group bacterium]
MRISAKTRQCIIIGDPVEHSLSPAMHNAAYRALGLDYIFTVARVTTDSLAAAVAGVRALGFRGLTVTIPHKIAILPLLDALDPVAKKIGAVNTVVQDNGILTGYNTDWLGTRTPLLSYGDLQGKRVALIGAGGAARAMAYAVTASGGHLSVFVRDPEKAKEFSDDFGARVFPLTEIAAVAEMDILLNSTPLGMGDQKDMTPIPRHYLRSHHIVFDAVYTPRKTRLLVEAAQAGARVIYGADMLLHQGTAQFTLYTGMPAPVDVMRSVLIPS